MIRKGIRFQRAYHLGWRRAQEGDTYVNGDPIENPYIVVVYIRDCKLNEQNRYNPDNAPVIPLTGHSRTNMVYGKQRTYNDKPYDTRSVYWVEDGFVYTGSIKLWNE